MIGFLLAAIGTAALLLIGQLLWRDKLLKGESARKFIHITVASYAAFWPYFVDRWWIVILSAIFVLALLVIKKLKIFKSMTTVKRATCGEICFALSIGALALVFGNNYIYTIALLHMALADGFAAIVGVNMAKRAKNFYYNGSRKSLAGTATFVLISFILNLAYWMVVSRISLQGNLIGLSPIFYSLLSGVALAGVEIIAPKGTDNVAVPFAAGLLLWLPVAIFV
jgi:dolichol kinase